MTRLLPRVAAPALAIALAVALGACAAPGGPRDLNDHDIAFAQEMIAHHEGALDMADDYLELEGTSPELREIAGAVRDAQEPEIELMTTWLSEWMPEGRAAESTRAESSPAGSSSAESTPADEVAAHEGHDGPVADGAPMTLEGLTGADADARFVDLMSEHHRGAIALAERELADGESPAARALAEKIIESQRAEIESMRAALTD